MYAALQTKGVKSEFITIPGAGHGFRGEDAAMADAKRLAWFDMVLQK